MRYFTLVLWTAALAAPTASAQAPVRTILLLTATDTIAVEQVTRGPGRLEEASGKRAVEEDADQAGTGEPEPRGERERSIVGHA